MRRHSFANVIWRILLYAILIAIFLIVVFPLIWIVITSLKHTYEVFTSPMGLPKTPTFKAFVDAWTMGKFGLFFLNSAVITAISVLGIIMLSSMAGYGFARYAFRGSRTIFLMFVVSLVVIPASLMISQTMILKYIHLLDSRAGIILVYLSWTVLGVMLTRIAYLEIPQDLVDAAVIDGAGELRIFWLLFPLIRPSVATIGVFAFIWVWNDFVWPLVLLQSPENQTIMVGVLSFQGMFTAEWPTMCAGLFMAIFPVIAIYLVLQKYFVRGLMTGAIK
jgi:ABC-type glycerol-3-phosphate transport system permease component